VWIVLKQRTLQSESTRAGIPHSGDMALHLRARAPDDGDRSA